MARRFRANVLWLGHAPLVFGRTYLVKIGAAKVPAELVELRLSIDASDLIESEHPDSLERHAVGECVLETSRPVAFDTTGDLEATARFVIVDGYDIAGFGTILEGVDSQESAFEARIRARESSWDRGDVTREEREARNRHAGKAVVLLGTPDAPSRPLAKALERTLFEMGTQAYLLLLSSEFDGLDPRMGDLVEREEHLQRLGELCRVMTDAGMLLVSALDGIEPDGLHRLRAVNAPSELFVVATTFEAAQDVGADLVLTGAEALDEAVSSVVSSLHSKGVMPEYWI